MTMVTLGILVFGWVSYQKLSLSLMPKIDFPTLTIRTEYLGTAPSEIESLITKPLEEELSVLGGLVDYYSVSKAGFSEITLQFDWKTNLTYTSLQVREKLDRVKLPKDAKKPLILKYDPSQEPIIRFAIYKGKGLQHLQSIAEKIIEPKLQSILGVASVKIRGGLEQEIRVLVDEKKISHLSLSMKKIHQILRSENVNLAGGKLKEGKQEYFIRTLSEFQTIQDIRKIIVHQNQHRKVRLQDVAKVILTTKEQEMFSKVNGLPAVEILIFKEGDSNIVEVAKRVKNILIQKAIPKIKTKKKAKKKSRFSRFRKKSKFTSKKSSSIEEALKPNVQIKIISDQSVFIKQAIAEVGNSAKTGAIFAALVLLIFLNSLRSTLLILISIPISIIATFVLMFWIDISLNIMSLGGLALGLGMLVDNSIVVLESIHQEQEQGKSMLDAASIGVTKVGGAIIASTLTTVAVFFPIVFIEGFAGQIFRDQALTIVFSLLVSLLVALYLIPTFTVALAKKEQVSTLKDTETKEDSIQWIFKIPIQFFHFTKQFFFDSFQKQYYIQFWIFLWRLLIIVTFILPFALFLFFIPIMAIIYGIRRLFKTVSNQSKIKNIFSFFHTFIQFLQNKYAQLLSGLLKFPKTVLLVITSLFVLSIFGIQLLSSELIPEVHQGTLKLEIQLPVGTPLNETEQKFSFIEKKLHAIPQIASIFSFAGSDTKSVTTEKEGSHLGKFTLNLKKLPAEKWNQIEDQVIQQIQGFLADSS
ncbi:MAG: HAE1 family hydrophobic/amphiphilic exporter-1, partial [bacterium]